MNPDILPVLPWVGLLALGVYTILRESAVTHEVDSRYGPGFSHEEYWRRHFVVERDFGWTWPFRMRR